MKLRRTPPSCILREPPLGIRPWRFVTLFSDFPEMLKSRNSELRTTHNTFMDYRVPFFPITCFEIAVYKFSRSLQVYLCKN